MVGEKLRIFMSFIQILATSLLEDSFFTVPLLTSAVGKKPIYISEENPNLSSYHLVSQSLLISQTKGAQSV